MANIKLLDNLGHEQTFDGVTKISVPAATEGSEQFIQPSGKANITSTAEINVADKATAQVVDANLVSSNIKSGVSILGVSGSVEPGITPTGNINITNTAQTDVTQYATAQVVDDNLVAGNIVSGKSILGVNGSATKLVGDTTTVKSQWGVSQTITPTAPANGFTSVTVEAMDLASVNQTLGASAPPEWILPPSGSDGLADVSQLVDTSVVKAENIKSGVSILGVSGSLTPGITPSGNINITNTTQTDVTNYATAQVVDANLTAGNIKSGVTILGVSGSLTPGITPSGNINITSTAQTNVTNYATAQVVDANLVAGNIKSGVSILGVSGSLTPGITPTGNINITNTT